MRPEANNWLRQAEKELESAKKNLDIGEFYLVAFLCQQAVEKALKALYIESRKEQVPPVHSLVFLGSELGIPKKHLSFLRRLNPEFVASRYPDAANGVPFEMYDDKIAEEILSKTEEVFGWVRSQTKR